jgi:hypothetical protein
LVTDGLVAQYSGRDFAGTEATPTTIYDTHNKTYYKTITIDQEYNLTSVAYAINITAPNGEVTRDPTSSNEINETVTLTAEPTTIGYYFNEWQGDLTSESSTETLVMSQSYTLTSEFLEYPTVKSKSIYLNSLPVTTARLTATTTSDNSNFIFGMSNVVTSGIEGIGVMEEVSNGTTHTFTDPTGQEVQYQIWGKVPGTSISKIRVRIN